MSSQKSSVWKIAGGGVAVFLVAASALGYATLDKLRNGSCAIEVLQTLPSPDGKLKAVVFWQNGGAATSDTEQVALLPADTELTNHWGNVFIADSGHGAAPNGPEVEAAWEGNERLSITYHPEAHASLAKPKVRVGLGFWKSRTVAVSYAQPDY